MDPRRLARTSRGQLGLFTRAQAGACGYSAEQIRNRVAAGQWRAVPGGVLAESGLRLTAPVRDRAAQLAVSGSVLAGPSAARVWGMTVPVSGPHLISARRVRHRLPGVRIIRATLDRPDVQIFEGALVTSRPRTVFDCLRLLDEREAIDLLDRALQRGWIALDDLIDRVRGHTGRRGAPRLVRLVRAASDGSRSAAERTLTRLLRDAGIGGWVANAPIADARGLIGVGDMVFPKARVVVEVDGWAFHITPDRFQHDRERQNRLVAAGWTVLRFTWRDLVGRPDHVVASVAAMVGRRT